MAGPIIRGRVVLALGLATLASAAPAAGDAVDDIIRADMAARKIPGLSLAIVERGEVVKAAGYGVASVELGAPATPATIYQAGSITKQFTATLVMSLVGEGKVGLRDPVYKYLGPGAPGWERVTVYHLLTHTAGVSGSVGKLIDMRRDYTEDELVARILGLPLEFEPGTRWAYSNPGYVLLGAMTRRVTGRPYGEELRRRVFAPLGMTTARIIDEADIIPNRASGYRLVGGELKNQEWVSPTINATADSGLYLSVIDLARWDAGLRRAAVLGRAGLEQMWTPARLDDGSTRPYGFGWELDRVDGRRLVEHSGTWQGFAGHIARFLDDDLTVIVLTNAVHGRPAGLVRRIAGTRKASPPTAGGATLPSP
jgi:CubicO group peptidase (beta-lactamase class C family)